MFGYREFVFSLIGSIVNGIIFWERFYFYRSGLVFYLFVSLRDILIIISIYIARIMIVL